MKKKFVVIACFLMATMLLTACDEGIVTYRYEFVQPPRLVYIANVDAELDFYGATVRGIARDFIYEEVPVELGRWMAVEHSIDFNMPGIYKVEFIRIRSEHRQFSIPFFIQVIDAEIFQQLSEDVG